MTRRALGLLVTAAVVVVAACGDDEPVTAPTAGDTTASGENTTPPAETTASPNTTTAPSDTPSTTPPTDSGAGADATALAPTVALTEIVEVDAPTDLAWREGDEALYVTEQGGRVQRVVDGEATTVLDITDLVEAGGEQGLLGVAFAPGDDLAYVNYTDDDGNTTVAEYSVDADGTFTGEDGDLGRVLFVIEQPYPNHNGGDLAFGPDGMLYIGMGDGGDRGDPERRATDLATPLGKLLRIDPAQSDEEAYTVPADNPYVDDGDADPRIWSSGLRNPWRFSFDRETGDLWIADVGQGAFEEIDFAPATDGLDAGRGLSFGWSAYEGDERYNEDVPAEGHTPPFFTYPHEGGVCSISGGVRARNETSLDGWYVYADYCAGFLAALEVLGGGADASPGRNVELGQVEGPTAVGDGPAGEVYVLSGAGPVLRLDPT